MFAITQYDTNIWYDKVKVNAEIPTSKTVDWYLGRVMNAVKNAATHGGNKIIVVGNNSNYIDETTSAWIIPRQGEWEPSKVFEERLGNWCVMFMHQFLMESSVDEASGLSTYEGFRPYSDEYGLGLFKAFSPDGKLVWTESPDRSV